MNSHTEYIELENLLNLYDFPQHRVLNLKNYEPYVKIIGMGIEVEVYEEHYCDCEYCDKGSLRVKKRFESKKLLKDYLKEWRLTEEEHVYSQKDIGFVKFVKQKEAPEFLE